MLTHVLKSIRSSKEPPCDLVELMPFSAIKRYALLCSKLSAALSSEVASQKLFSASLPCRFTLACCKNFEIMMYHVPIDISTNINKVDLATKSPSRQSASRP